MLDKLWDDVVAGPQPARGLGKLRQKLAAQNPLIIQNSDVGESSGGAQAGKPSLSAPSTPTTPATPTTPTSARAKHDVWRSVFNPGSNLATRRISTEIFDKPKPNSPSVYDWLYSGETRSTHR